MIDYRNKEFCAISCWDDWEKYCDKYFTDETMGKMTYAEIASLQEPDGRIINAYLGSHVLFHIEIWIFIIGTKNWQGRFLINLKWMQPQRIIIIRSGLARHVFIAKYGQKIGIWGSALFVERNCCCTQSMKIMMIEVN